MFQKFHAPKKVFALFEFFLIFPQDGKRQTHQNHQINKYDCLRFKTDLSIQVSKSFELKYFSNRLEERFEQSCIREAVTPNAHHATMRSVNIAHG